MYFVKESRNANKQDVFHKGKFIRAGLDRKKGNV